jgi:hypothetical protein
MIPNLTFLPWKISFAALLLGILLMFIGVVTWQASISYEGLNPLGLLWYSLFYGVLICICIFYSWVTDTIKEMKLALVGSMAAFLGFAPVLLDKTLDLAGSSGKFAGGCGPQVFSSGLILTILPLFIMMFVVGSPGSALADLFDIGVTYEEATPLAAVV